MNKPIHLLILAVLALSGCQTTESILSEKPFTLKGDYGTITYNGFGMRVDYKSHVLVRIDELHLDYVEDAKTNKIPVAELKKVRLSATARPASGKGSWDVLYQDLATIDVELSESSGTKTVMGVQLSIPKRFVEKADQVGLSLVGERLLWPMRPKLKYVEQSVPSNES